MAMARSSSDKDYIAALDKALARIEAFAPFALAVALGLEVHESDPLKRLVITTAGFDKIANRIAALELPVLISSPMIRVAKLIPFLEGFQS